MKTGTQICRGRVAGRLAPESSRTVVCIWAGGHSQGEVLAEVILVLEFLACESTATVLVVLTDTGRKS
jgi:hypothetical protein